MKILVIIPAFNEEKSIYNVVKSIKLNYDFIDIVVINDGSKDKTYDEALKAGAKVIDLPFNLGIGGAVQTGYIYALENHYDIAIQIDGDGQHSAKDIERVIRPLVEEGCDMVIGSRFLMDTAYQPGSFRKLGISFFSKLVSLLCGERYYDTTSGYRAVNKKGIKLFCEYYPKDYPEVETIVYALRNGLCICEIPVEMNYRVTGKSSITPIKSVYYMLKVTFCTIFLPKQFQGK